MTNKPSHSPAEEDDELSSIRRRKDATQKKSLDKVEEADGDLKTKASFFLTRRNLSYLQRAAFHRPYKSQADFLNEALDEFRNKYPFPDIPQEAREEMEKKKTKKR